MKKLLFALASLSVACSSADNSPIDRQALVTRHNIAVDKFDPLSSVSVGNGKFAFTVDATGLQTFPDFYKAGVPLGTHSEWGWHSFPNPKKLRHEETLRDYDFRGKPEPYAIQYKEPERNKEASDWYRVNPHRIHLGYMGLETNGLTPEQIAGVKQTTDLWNGRISSTFTIAGQPVAVETVCSPSQDMVATTVSSPLMGKGDLKLNFRFPYPSGGHSDDASDWNSPEKHATKVVEQGNDFAVLERTLDSTTYFVRIEWNGPATLTEKDAHYFVLTPQSDSLSVSCLYSQTNPAATNLPEYAATADETAAYWNSFWQRGGAGDFSQCKDPRAAELERRVVLSQYLTALQCAGSFPPAESGLTYNTWYGRPHLEMHWWHGVHFALWGRPDLLERSLDWYPNVAYPVAKQIAQRQGFDGIRWMKMTDNWANEAPSSVGSFLTWQQPHYIYFAELMYRSNPTPEVLERYKDMVFETAKFMASFPTYEELEIRYVLKGMIPAQETLRASETINPPFELSYWHWALSTAQQWRERLGMGREPQWDVILDKLSPLAAKDGKYLASEDAVDTYSDVRFTSDHMIVLGAFGMLPKNKLFTEEIMGNTFDWIWDNWNWGRTWGWDYPMTAMSAARLGKADKAVDALLMEKRTNTYLANGHNYQDDRLRIYLPGNGGLLTAVAMMCAGWDGSEGDCPGFPKDGNWNVKWEGLEPMP